MKSFRKENNIEVQSMKCTEFADIITTQIYDSELNQNLVQEIKKLSSLQVSKNVSHDDFTNMYVPAEQFTKAQIITLDVNSYYLFKQVCNLAIKTIYQSVDKDNKIDVKDCWAAIYNKGDICQEHKHGVNAWSFVYYVQSTLEDAPLLFPTADFSIFPTTGLLVIFPCWITHSVPQQQSVNERIVIAGNLG